MAEFYRRFAKIYFPVRLDQTSRLYCTTSYLNYQSNELTRALLLFAYPCIISRYSMQSIIYLKRYGANCFGGMISKGSIKSKLEWVNKNQDDVINYDNGNLLNKAKDKLALSFSIQYKRFYSFLTYEMPRYYIHIYLYNYMLHVMDLNIWHY